MTRAQKDQIKERLQIGTMLVSLAVGLTVLGLVPKCSEIQTTKAAKEQHDAIKDEVALVRETIQRDMRRVIEANTSALSYQRRAFDEIKEMIQHGNR